MVLPYMQATTMNCILFNAKLFRFFFRSGLFLPLKLLGFVKWCGLSIMCCWYLMSSLPDIACGWFCLPTCRKKLVSDELDLLLYSNWVLNMKATHIVAAEIFFHVSNLVELSKKSKNGNPNFFNSLEEFSWIKCSCYL